MKRYRVLATDFDSRVQFLTLDIQPHWDDRVKEMHLNNRVSVERGLIREFGESNAEHKRKNFIDMGPKPLSILAYHNRFLEQIRLAFVLSAYYPALTAACSLGERILNYLILSLREDFRSRPEYKKVHNKDSFDNWSLAIDTLEAWQVLLPEVVDEYRTFRSLRNDAIHFRPEVDHNDRQLALDAINQLGRIVNLQFGMIGAQPWLIRDIPGESYIKRDWESTPFIQKVYLPNCKRLGPNHKVLSIMPWKFRDEQYDESHVISDDEFCAMRRGIKKS